jgi:hypothetical protein
MSDTGHDRVCPDCGAEMAPGASICAACGWDSTTAVVARPRRSPLRYLAAGGWRLVVYGAIAAIPLLAFVRLQQTGPGPDLATTVAWLALGDGGRAAELVTLHRAHEVASAAARYAVRELEPPSFEAGWDEALEPYATMNVRGWLPLLFFGADAGLAPASVREFFVIRAVDGWGRPYRVATRPLPRAEPWADEPEVAADLSAGLWQSFFVQTTPDFSDRDFFRLELTSAGPDGVMDSPDDVALVSYIPAGLTLRLSQSPADLQRRLEVAYTVGRHFFRLVGSRWDLIDARLLAEYRLETLS